MKLKQVCFFVWMLLGSASGFGQTRMSTEDAFQDLFITAGYSTAFGAALGTAFIGLSGKNPMTKLNYIAVGASIGFIAGSALGAHLILNPSLGYDSGARAEVAAPPRFFSMVPVFSERGVVGVATNFMTWVN